MRISDWSSDVCSSDLKFPGRHIAGLFEQRHVATVIVVALDARIAVPVPDAAEVAGMIDVAKRADAGIAQINAGNDAGKAGAEDRDVEVLKDRRARLNRHVRIGLLAAGEVVLRLDILFQPFATT